MHKELTQQATRLGLIFARYGIHLTRAEKLELTAEVHGKKSWAVLAGQAKQASAPEGLGTLADTPASIPAYWSPAVTPLTPLQQVVAQYFGSGDFSHMEYVEDIHPGDDTLFEYVMKEALEARENPDEFVSMLNTAKHDLDQVIEGVEQARNRTSVSDLYWYANVGNRHDEKLAWFSDGSVSTRHMSYLYDAQGARIEPGKYLLSTHETLDENGERKEQLLKVAAKVGLPVVSYENELGLLAERTLFTLRAKTREDHQAKLQKLRYALQTLEHNLPGCVAGASVELKYVEGANGVPTHYQAVEVWVYIPYTVVFEAVALEVKEYLENLDKVL